MPLHHHIPLPPRMVLAPPRCSGGIGEAELTGESTEAQRGQGESDTTCLMVSLIPLSCHHSSMPVCLVQDLRITYISQTTTYILVCTITHVFSLPNPSFLPHVFSTSCPTASDQQGHWKARIWDTDPLIHRKTHDSFLLVMLTTLLKNELLKVARNSHVCK